MEFLISWKYINVLFEPMRQFFWWNLFFDIWWTVFFLPTWGRCGNAGPRSLNFFCKPESKFPYFVQKFIKFIFVQFLNRVCSNHPPLIFSSFICYKTDSSLRIDEQKDSNIIYKVKEEIKSKNLLELEEQTLLQLFIMECDPFFHLSWMILILPKSENGLILQGIWNGDKIN